MSSIDITTNIADTLDSMGLVLVDRDQLRELIAEGLGSTGIDPEQHFCDDDLEEADDLSWTNARRSLARTLIGEYLEKPCPVITVSLDIGVALR